VHAITCSCAPSCNCKHRCSNTQSVLVTCLQVDCDSLQLRSRQQPAMEELSKAERQKGVFDRWKQRGHASQCAAEASTAGASLSHHRMLRGDPHCCRLQQ
jgi:hypothetical protein